MQFLHFRLEEPIPSPSGATEAFVAKSEKEADEVVLERVREGASPVEKGRFATRARRLSTVKHPLVARVVELGPTWCAFESPAGALLTQHAGLSPARTRPKLGWMASLSEALAALHAAGLVHGRVGLDRMCVLPDRSVRLLLHVGAEPSGSPFDDVRAFVASAAELLLGKPVPFDLSAPLDEAGVPYSAVQALAAVHGGKPMPSADLAVQLAPFTEAVGPATEPLIPIARR